jgi:hypothetical protein
MSEIGGRCDKWKVWVTDGDSCITWLIVVGICYDDAGVVIEVGIVWSRLDEKGN